MAFALALLDLAGAVALLLWGVHMVQTGVQRAFGARLRTALAAALRDRARAFVAGIGITAALQSSTAAGLMVTGFAAGGLVDLVPALAVMLGANVGTTLIVQVLSFDVAAAASALVLVGVLLFRRATDAWRDSGRVLIGLGLMLMALRRTLELVVPYEDVPGLRPLLGLVSAQPVLAVVLAAALTWAAHSSVAIVLLVVSLAAKGAVPLDAAFALVLGANLGTAVNPVLEGGAGGDPAARRVPLGNLLARLVGVLAALTALPVLVRLAAGTGLDDARAVAGFHTLFNLALAAIFLPVLPAYAALLRRLIPERADPDDPSRPLYLDPAARGVPAVALGAAAREALRLADVLQDMLLGARDALGRDDHRRAAGAKRLGEVLDKLGAEIKTYLTALDPEAMAAADHRRVGEILAFVANLEQAGDAAARLHARLGQGAKRGLSLPPDARAELAAALDRVLANLRMAASLFVTEDVRAARLLAAEKEAFREVEARAEAAQFEGLRLGRVEAVEVGPLHLDALRDLKQVNACLVAAAAYPVLEGRGELLPTRLRQAAEG